MLLLFGDSSVYAARSIVFEEAFGRKAPDREDSVIYDTDRISIEVS